MSEIELQVGNYYLCKTTNSGFVFLIKQLDIAKRSVRIEVVKNFAYPGFNGFCYWLDYDSLSKNSVKLGKMSGILYGD